MMGVFRMGRDAYRFGKHIRKLVTQLPPKKLIRKVTTPNFRLNITQGSR